MTLGTKPRQKMERAKKDAERYEDKVREGRKLALRALAKYGKPTMTLEELRKALAKELGGVSLSEVVIKDRESS